MFGYGQEKVGCGQLKGHGLIYGNIGIVGYIFKGKWTKGFFGL